MSKEKSNVQVFVSEAVSFGNRIFRTVLGFAGDCVPAVKSIPSHWKNNAVPKKEADKDDIIIDDSCFKDVESNRTPKAPKS